MTSATKFALVFLVAAAACSRPVGAQTVPPGFVIEQVYAGFQGVRDFCVLPDGRLLVLSDAQFGSIVAVVPGVSMPRSVNTVGSLPYLSPFPSNPNSGAMSIAADPDFENNGHVWIWYYGNLPNIGAPTGSSGPILVRYSLFGDATDSLGKNLRLDPTSEIAAFRRIGTGTQYGETIRFGPDGMLYLALGDFSNSFVSPCSAQDLGGNEGNGLVLRMDVSSLGLGTNPTFLPEPQFPPQQFPPDNPLSGAATSALRLAIAWGVGNPASMAIDESTGDVYFTDDAGQASEINRVAKQGGVFPGANFGWPWFDGIAAGITCTATLPPVQHEEPIVLEATPGASAAEVVGIHRNAGRAHDWGASYEGDLFHVDTSGQLVRRRFDATSGVWIIAPPEMGQAAPGAWGSGFAGCRRFQRGHDGSLLYVTSSGAIARIRRSVSSGANDQSLATVAGSGQVGVRGKAFKIPLEFELTDTFGAAVPGEAVAFDVVGGKPVTPPIAITDGQGRVSVVVEATGGGLVEVVARSPGIADPGVVTSCFSRGLSIGRIPPGLFIFNYWSAAFANTTAGATAPPHIFALTDDAIPPVGTPFGLLGIGLFDGVGLWIIDDPACLVTCTVYGQSNIPFFPGQVIYELPAGFAGTFRFQVVVVDPTITTSIAGTQDSIFGLSNIVTLTF